MEVESIGVVGAGQMGAGIAQVAACSGYQVTMADINEEAVSRGMDTIRSSLQKLTSRGKISQQTAASALGCISTTVSIQELGGSDLVVEAVPEIKELKTRTFEQLDRLCKDEAILATNTSSISIDSIASSTNRPGRVIGMHFMNPVPVMKLVEVIKGTHTEPEVTAEVTRVVESLGKTPLECNDSPGFVSNRILCPMINEAIITLDEGVADPEAIDGIMKLGMNHPIGPLALADLIGLDTVLNIMRVLHEGLADDKYKPAPLLVSMVEEGKLGRKTKKGFYEY